MNTIVAKQTQQYINKIIYIKQVVFPGRQEWFKNQPMQFTLLVETK